MSEILNLISVFTNFENCGAYYGEISCFQSRIIKHHIK